jgi:hypothetical protein
MLSSLSLQTYRSRDLGPKVLLGANVTPKIYLICSFDVELLRCPDGNTSASNAGMPAAEQPDSESVANDRDTCHPRRLQRAEPSGAVRGGGLERFFRRGSGYASYRIRAAGFVSALGSLGASVLWHGRAATN